VNLTTVIVEQPDDAQLHELVLLCRTEGDGQEDVSVLVKERLNVEPSHRIADCVDEP
jgi:hypothetical protein